MGGFNLGELAGVLRLDDSDFRRKVADSEAALALLGVGIRNVLNPIEDLKNQLVKAGFSAKEFSVLLGQFTRQAEQGESGIYKFNDSLNQMKEAFAAIRREAADAKEAAQGVVGLGRQQNSGLTPSQATERRQAITKIEAEAITAKQRQEYQALVEAQRISYELAKKKFDQENDYSGLVKRLRQQEQEATSQRKAGDAEGARQEREYAAQKLAVQQAAARDYQNLVAQMRAQEVKAAQEARAKIDADAAARRTEMQARMVGDAQARLRIEQEEEAERYRRQRAAEARERAAFIEHRRQMQVASAATTIGITAGAVGGAGLGAGLFVAKDAAQFQDAMAKSLAVIGDLADDAKNRIAQAARDSAKETGLAAKDIAADFAIAAKGGLDVAQSLDFVPKAARFAIATNSELHESTRQVITIMEALQMPVRESGKVMDELTLANQLARGSVDSLATMLEGKAGAALRSAKVSLEEALAMSVAFSKAGVSSAQGQTFLTQVIERLSYAARQYGDEIVDVSGKQMKFRDIMYLSDGSVRPFIQTLKLLDEAFKGRSAEAVGRFFDDIHLGSARGAQGLKIFLSQSSVIDELVGKFRELVDEMRKAFDQQMQSPLKQLDRFKAQLTDLAITLGIPTVAAIQSAANALTPLFKGVQSLIEKFKDLPQPVQTGTMLILGIGSAGLVASGGLLVFLGHIIRLRADLALLESMGVLKTFASTLTGIASTASIVAVAILGVGAAIAALKKEHDRLKESGADNVLDPKSGSTFYGFGYHVDPMRYQQRQQAKTAQPPAKKEGEDTAQGFLDGFRKRLEEIRSIMQDAFKPGDFAINPEKVLTQTLKIDDIKRQLSSFENDFESMLDRMDDGQESVIRTSIQRAQNLLKAKADPRLILDVIKNGENDLKALKKQFALDDKAEARQNALDSAAASIAAFKERYMSGLKTLTQDEQALIEAGIRGLEQSVRSGASPKEIANDLKLVEGQYKIITDAITDTTRVTNELNAAQKKYETSERREVRQKPELPAAIDRVPEALKDTLSAKSAVGKELTQTDDAMRRLGLTSQYTLDLGAAKSRTLYAELKSIDMVLNSELREAWLSVREAEIKAAEGLKPYAAEFVRVRMEMERLKAEGNQSDRLLSLTKLEIQTKALDWALNGVGKTGRNVLQELSSGWNQLGATIVKSFRHIEDFGKIWKDMLGNLLENVMGAFIQGLLNMLGGWILKTLGMSKVVGVGQIQTAAAIGEANAMAATAMIPIVGPALALAAGEAMYGTIMATALPKLVAFEQGGFVDKTQMALVHGGEYVANAKMTRGLQALVDNGMSGGGGDHYDFRGATFGAGLTPGSVEAMMRPVVSKLRRASGRSRGGKF